MKIITISREFGSGGRELGKRLADVLGFDYYDKEIISTIAENKGLSEGYVENILENHGWQNIPLNYGHSFICLNPMISTQTDLLFEQKEVIEKIAKSNKDCIIVGRNADVLLKDYNTFNIFVCANMEDKVARCLERSREDENLNDKEVRKLIKKIDKNRARTHELISDSIWGHSDSYHLTINTSGWEIKELVPAVAEFINHYFDRKTK